ncbi:transposase [Rhodobacteraceae bacterium B1Z28]|uniref:Transposase n=1 Tax=Ruegeria haliotis TaxID=2747601 RepID=A0ABX2PV57_9RHOB|nr:transposase [Ruegeria haliotis]
MPDFSTLCRRQRTLNVSLPFRRNPGPLNLLIDSTSIKAPLGCILWMRLPGSGGRRRLERPQARRLEAAHLAQDTHPFPPF